jgi:hypothetical protein
VPRTIFKAEIAHIIAASYGFCPFPVYFRDVAIDNIVEFAEDRGQFRHPEVFEHTLVKAGTGVEGNPAP